MSDELEVELERFDLCFKVKYAPGNPQAGLYSGDWRMGRPDRLIAWLSVQSVEGGGVVFDASNDQRIVPPDALGLDTDDVADNKFLLEAEEYLLSKLAEALSAELAGQKDITLSTPSPRDRGERVVELFRGHPSGASNLGDLVATEIYDALETFGLHLSDALDDAVNDGLMAAECGEYVRATAVSTIEDWRMEES